MPGQGLAAANAQVTPSDGSVARRGPALRRAGGRESERGSARLADPAAGCPAGVSPLQTWLVSFPRAPGGRLHRSPATGLWSPTGPSPQPAVGLSLASPTRPGTRTRPPRSGLGLGGAEAQQCRRVSKQRCGASRLATRGLSTRRFLSLLRPCLVFSRERDCLAWVSLPDDEESLVQRDGGEVEHRGKDGLCGRERGTSADIATEALAPASEVNAQLLPSADLTPE